MQNILHKVSNKSSYLLVTEFNDLIRVYYSNDTYGTCSYSYLDKKHLDAIKKYKSPLGATRYAGKHDIVKGAKQQQDLEIKYARYLCQSPPNDSPESTPCPVPAPAPAKSAAKERGILFCDTEATGLGKHDEIVEIALVDINENIIFESLVKPSKPIPKQATQVHGITNAMVAGAPTFAEIWSSLYDTMIDSNLIFYNADFDTRMIAQSMRIAFDYPSRLTWSQILKDRKIYCNITTQCLMTHYAEYWGEYSNWHGSYRWQKLTDALYQQDIRQHDVHNHRASGDAIKAVRLYKFMAAAGVAL